jgi:hypothetical protein
MSASYFAYARATKLLNWGHRVRVAHPPVNLVHLRTLRRALQTVGTLERLATALEVLMSDLEAYMTGEKAVPNRVFLAALDIVAHCSNPTRRQKR